MVHVTNALPPGATGIDLDAMRERAGTGVTLRAKLRPDRPEQSRMQTGGSTTTESPSTGGPSAEPSSGTCSLGRGQSRRCWSDLARKLDGALASDPYTPFERRLDIVLTK